jgi:hypothetical protein
LRVPETRKFKGFAWTTGSVAIGHEIGGRTSRASKVQQSPAKTGTGRRRDEPAA